MLILVACSPRKCPLDSRSRRSARSMFALDCKMSRVYTIHQMQLLYAADPLKASFLRLDNCPIPVIWHWCKPPSDCMSDFDKSNPTLPVDQSMWCVACCAGGFCRRSCTAPQWADQDIQSYTHNHVNMGMPRAQMDIYPALRSIKWLARK